VHTTYSTKKYAEVYLDQIVRLHGPSFLIEGHNLLPASGNNCSMLLEPN
jgi:hypothetical protein